MPIIAIVLILGSNVAWAIKRWRETEAKRKVASIQYLESNDTNKYILECDCPSPIELLFVQRDVQAMLNLWPAEIDLTVDAETSSLTASWSCHLSGVDYQVEIEKMVMKHPGTDFVIWMPAQATQCGAKWQ